MLGKKYGFRSLLKYRFLKQSLLQEFEQWKKKAPNNGFQGYYVAMELEKIKKGKSHPSLGSNIKNEEYTQSGLAMFEKLQRWGLQSHHICVDYGCGSLRIGQHIIAALQPTHYYGLDVTDQFFTIGKQLLSPTLLQEKKPQLFQINDEVLKKVAQRGADYIFSNGVLIHIPPFELNAFLKNILGLIRAGTKLYIGMAAYEKNIQFSRLSWAYNKDFVKEEIHQIDADLAISFIDFYDVIKPTILGNLNVQKGTILVSKNK